MLGDSSVPRPKPLVVESTLRVMPNAEPIDDVGELTDEEEAGIEAAIESVRQGKGVSVEAAKARIDRILGR